MLEDKNFDPNCTHINLKKDHTRLYSLNSLGSDFSFQILYFYYCCSGHFIYKGGLQNTHNMNLPLDSRQEQTRRERHLDYSQRRVRLMGFRCCRYQRNRSIGPSFKDSVHLFCGKRNQFILKRLIP